MESAKINSLIAFIFNTIFTIIYFNLFLKIRQVFQELKVPMQFSWLIFIPLILAIGSLGYWFYLKRKESKGEKAKFALLISYIFLLAYFVYIPIILISLMQPLYDLLLDSTTMSNL